MKIVGSCVMRKLVWLSWVVMMVGIVLLPGCRRLVDWGYDTFYQGEYRGENLCEVPYYIRSVRVYKELMTRGIFDVLWLSDDMRQLYTKLYAQRTGLNEDRYVAMLRRQLEENSHYISFYVLSLYDVSIGDKNSRWTVLLKVGDDYFQPFDVKKIDINPELCVIFGSRCNRFKNAYEIKFFAHHHETDELLMNGDEGGAIQFVFRSIDHEAAVVWYVDEQGRSVCVQGKQHK